MGNRVFTCLAAASVLALTACGGPTNYSYSGVTVAITPQVASVPAGGTQAFSTTVANAPNFPLWILNGTQFAGQTSTSIGSFTTPTTDGPSGTYTAPATPPIYTLSQINAGLVQGSVTLSAAVHSSATNVLSEVDASTTFAIVGPISAGFLTPTATVNLGTSVQLYPYVVGTLSNTYILKVNGFTGGGTDVGTISATGVYTAPATMPVSGSTITITIVSTADSTKTGTAIITLH